MDVLAVKSATERAAGYVRPESKPFLRVAKTDRFRAHSMYDPDLYRSKDEVEKWKERCPLAAFEAILLKQNETDESLFGRLESEVEKEVAEAVASADAGELEPLEDLTKDVYTPKQ